MDYTGMAAQVLSSKPTKKTPHKPLKEFHAKELHDGTYMHRKMHGKDQYDMPVKPDEEGSGDLDAVHDAMEEHMGGKMEEKKESAKERKAEKKTGEE